MRDLLKEIDDGWFSDADDTNPGKGPPALKALSLELSNLPAPGALTPMPLTSQALQTEEWHEAVKPAFIAVGTIVDVQVPATPWFSELQSLVPRRRPKPATLPSIPTDHRTSAHNKTISNNEDASNKPAKRKSWWRRK